MTGMARVHKRGDGHSKFFFEPHTFPQPSVTLPSRCVMLSFHGSVHRRHNTFRTVLTQWSLKLYWNCVPFAQ